MKEIDRIELLPGSTQEQLPDFRPEFPCITTRASLFRYPQGGVPWHWHGAVEVFCMERGTLEYATPGGTWIFPAGSGGFVNANVLHSTRILPDPEGAVELLHLFDSGFLAGDPRGLLYEKYIRPLTSSGVELLPLLPGDPLLPGLRASFNLADTQFGYEFALRQALTELWLGLLPRIPGEKSPPPGDAAIKAMLLFIRGQFPREITVEDIARAGAVSRRGCFRLFREQLSTTPVQYLRDFRLRCACDLLRRESLSITEVAGRCGLGSGSYFGQQFRQEYGITPSQYRQQWHDIENIRHK